MSTQIVMRGLVLFLVPFSLAKLDPVYTWLGRGRVGALQVAVLALLVIYAAFEFFFRKTSACRRFLLTGGNRRASFISGINTEKVVILAFVLAGFLSAIAGLITAGRQNAVSNNMGTGLVMMAFACAILGGCSFNGGMGMRSRRSSALGEPHRLILWMLQRCTGFRTGPLRPKMNEESKKVFDI